MAELSSTVSRRRDYHSAETFSPSRLIHQLKAEGGAAEWQNSRQGLRAAALAALGGAAPPGLRCDLEGEVVVAAEVRTEPDPVEVHDRPGGIEHVFAHSCSRGFPQGLLQL